MNSSERKKRRAQFWKDKVSGAKRKKCSSSKENGDKSRKKGKNSGMKPKRRQLENTVTSGARRGFKSNLTDVGSVTTGPDRGFRSKLAVGVRLPDVQGSERAAPASGEHIITSPAIIEAMESSSDSEDSCVGSVEVSDDDVSVTGRDIAGKQGKKSPKENPKKKRYILFVGNLPASASREDIISHFKKRGVPMLEFRLLTHKDSGKSRGCGFMELLTSTAMHNALKFHRSRFQGKNINVEATCGGGGKGEMRKKRIMDKNRKLRLKKGAAHPVKHNTCSS